MRQRNPNEDTIRKLMGKPPRKKGGVRRNPNYKGPISKDSEKMSFRERLLRLMKGRGAIKAISKRDTTKPLFAKAMGKKKTSGSETKKKVNYFNKIIFLLLYSII